MQDSIEFDIDCDSLIDFKILLNKGNPNINIPNSAYIIRVDSNIEFCAADTLQYPYTYVSWYKVGDTLSCPNNYSWKKTNQYYKLASNGGFGTLGPEGSEGLITDSFIIFRKLIGSNYAVGWLNIDAFLPYTNSSNPYLKTNSYTAFCTPNSTINYNQLNLFQLYPSLTEDNIYISSQENNFKIKILNQVGQLIMKKEFSESGQHSISLQEFSNGHYFVRYESENGNQVIRIQKN